MDPNWPLHLKIAIRASNCTAKEGLSIVEQQGFAPPELLLPSFTQEDFASFSMPFSFYFSFLLR